MRPVAHAILLVLLSGHCAPMHAQTSKPPETPQPGVVPQLPTPDGPYGIGRIGYDWTDTARHDRYTPQAHRELMVHVWYPTAKENKETRGTYMPGAKAMDAAPETQAGMREDYGANWPLIVSGSIVSHTVDNAPVGKHPSQFPLVILSHGMGGSGFGYTALIENLVSHGYAVAAIEHPGSAGAVVFPDGRIVPFQRDAPAPGLSREEQWKRMMQSVTAGIEEGAADVRFVLDRLTDLNAGNPESELHGRLDLKRVAAMGHSAGAEFAARACELDGRFEACVDLDGGMVPVAALPEYPDGAIIRQPLLFLEAYHDEAHMGGTHEQHVAYFKKREEQLKECPPGTYAVVLRSHGIVHGSFSDDPFLEAKGRPDRIDSARHNFDLITTYVRAFLDKTLKHDTGTLFDTHHPAIREADVVSYGG